MNKLIFLSLIASAAICQSVSEQALNIEGPNGFTPDNRLFNLKQQPQPTPKPAHCSTAYLPNSGFTGCKYCYSGYYKNTND
jgi:hypothetical protein